MYELKLEDFEHAIIDKKLVFTGLKNNKEKNIKFLDKYKINGEEYTVSEIDEYSFAWSNIEKIIIPKNVTEIKKTCFFKCENLTDVVLHDNIKKLGKFSFEKTKIEKFVIPPLVSEIPDYCFNYCNRLSEITLNNVKTIYSNAFYNCKKLNIFYQNDKDIYIDDYKELINKEFSDVQINQIFKGYKNGIFLNNLSKDIPVDIFRIIVNNFDKDREQFSNIIRKLENSSIDLNDKLNIYDEIDILLNNKNLDNKDVEHII